MGAEHDVGLKVAIDVTDCNTALPDMHAVSVIRDMVVEPNGPTGHRLPGAIERGSGAFGDRNDFRSSISVQIAKCGRSCIDAARGQRQTALWLSIESQNSQRCEAVQ